MVAISENNKENMNEGNSSQSFVELPPAKTDLHRGSSKDHVKMALDANNLSRTKWVHLNTVLTNNPDRPKLKETPTYGYLNPLKKCMEQFEHLENKHQLISKLSCKMHKNE